MVYLKAGKVWVNLNINLTPYGRITGACNDSKSKVISKNHQATCGGQLNTSVMTILDFKGY